MRGAPAAAARVAKADFDGLLYSITTPVEGLIKWCPLCALRLFFCHASSYTRACTRTRTGPFGLSVVTGATDGPWQQLRPGLALAAPHRSVGDRVTKATYYANKKLRHKQQQFQADFPANKKYGMARPMPPSYSTILPPALADSPMGLQMLHSLALALARSGV